MASTTLPSPSQVRQVPNVSRFRPQKKKSLLDSAALASLRTNIISLFILNNWNWDSEINEWKGKTEFNLIRFNETQGNE